MSPFIKVVTVHWTVTVHWLYSLTPWSHLKFRRQWGFYFRCWAASYLHFYRLSSYQIGPVTKDNKFLLRTNPPFHRSKVGLLNWAQLRRSIKSIVLIFTSITDDERSSEEIRHPPVILTGRWNISVEIAVKMWGKDYGEKYEMDNRRVRIIWNITARAQSMVSLTPRGSNVVYKVDHSGSQEKSELAHYNSCSCVTRRPPNHCCHDLGAGLLSNCITPLHCGQSGGQTQYYVLELLFWPWQIKSS